MFVSVLVQRYAELQPRLRDQQFGYAPKRGMRIYTGFQLGRVANAPSEHADVVRDCGRLLDVPLENHRRFIKAFAVLPKVGSRCLRTALT